MIRKQNHNAVSSIWEHWPVLAGIGGLLITIGQVFGDIRTMRSNVNDLEDRINKQYQNIREVNERVVSVEKWVEYNKGYEQAKKEYILSLPAIKVK